MCDKKRSNLNLLHVIIRLNVYFCRNEIRFYASNYFFIWILLILLMKNNENKSIFLFYLWKIIAECRSALNYKNIFDFQEYGRIPFIVMVSMAWLNTQNTQISTETTLTWRGWPMHLSTPYPCLLPLFDLIFFKIPHAKVLFR